MCDRVPDHTGPIKLVIAHQIRVSRIYAELHIVTNLLLRPRFIPHPKFIHLPQQAIGQGPALCKMGERKVFIPG